MRRFLRGIKNLLRANRVVQLAMLAWEYFSDFYRFVRHSASFKVDTKEKLRAKITRQYHIIEKGFALRNPETTLSRFRVKPVMDDIDTFISSYGVDSVVRNALSALYEFGRYLETENSKSVDGVTAESLLAWISNLEKRFEISGSILSRSSTIRLNRESIHAQAVRDLKSFFSSRHSVRQFDNRRVDDVLIEQAIEMALHTPSACNRQPWKVYVVREPRLKRSALALQGGNSGFGEQADVILIVTGNLSATLHPGERMQPWLDGGMFAMSLIYGLHSLGLGTCCLNWSKSKRTDRQLRRLLGLPENEVVLMMIAVGHLPEEFEVASSPRYPLSDVMRKIE